MAQPFEGYRFIASGDTPNSDCQGAPGGYFESGYFEKGALITLVFENPRSQRNLDVIGISVQVKHSPEFQGQPYRTDGLNPKGAVEESFDVTLDGPSVTALWRGADKKKHKVHNTNIFKFLNADRSDRSISIQPHGSKVISLVFEGDAHGLYDIEIGVMVAGSQNKKSNSSFSFKIFNWSK